MNNFFQFLSKRKKDFKKLFQVNNLFLGVSFDKIQLIIWNSLKQKKYYTYTRLFQYAKLKYILLIHVKIIYLDIFG